MDICEREEKEAMESTTELRQVFFFISFSNLLLGLIVGFCAFDLLPFEPYHNVHDANDKEKSILSGLLFPRDWLCQLVMWLQGVLSVSTSLFFMCLMYFKGIKNYFP